MNKSINKSISDKQVLDFFCREAKLEKDKNESRQKVMDKQLSKVTGGKNILIANKPK